MKLRLKAIRTERGLTQDEMAEKLGIKSRTYGSWERGEVMLNLEQAYNCAQVLECTIDDLVRELPKVEYGVVSVEKED